MTIMKKEENTNWQLTEPLYAVRQAMEDKKGVKVGINKDTLEFMLWTPGYGFKVFKFNPVIGDVTLAGAEEAFLNSPTYSDPVTVEQIKELITKIEV